MFHIMCKSSRAVCRLLDDVVVAFAKGLHQSSGNLIIMSQHCLAEDSCLCWFILLTLEL